MTRKAVAKSPEPSGTPNLPQHNIPEPFASLQTAGYEEQLDLYQQISTTNSQAEQDSRIDRLTDMALDESYYSYSQVDSDDDIDVRCFTPLQAVRALCYFAEQVSRVVPRLIPLFETDDSALREELPLLFTCIGLDAVETLVQLTIDTEADIYLRDGAAESLVEMANVYIHLNPLVLQSLETALIACNDAELAGYLVTDLLDLGAIGSLPLIEAAFLEQRVDNEVITLTEVHEHFKELLDNSDSGEPSLRLANTIPGEEEEERVPFVAGEKVGRNEPCPCGSGKKYKKCCG